MKWIKENPALAVAATAVIAVLVYKWYCNMQAKKKAAAAAITPPVAG